MPDEARINLSKASILAIETSQHAVDTLAQICKGFEAREVHRCLTIAEAETALRLRQVNLILINPSIEADAGFDFIRALRSSGAEPLCSVPIIVFCGHATPGDVARCRNTGANFVVAKPISSGALLQRIEWVARDQRQFVDTGDYVGPDRRFKFEGPPPGMAGRREGDKLVPLGDAQEPNLSQNDIDAFLKPQKVMH
ncbi:MAG: response regulator [Hyphomonadaceae bacterium JAD_PAG50586_4]|nr:MAG: response regulator [Hyphomonadaceae bacterium JAD_PAG50586_4]